MWPQLIQLLEYWMSFLICDMLYVYKYINHNSLFYKAEPPKKQQNKTKTESQI